MTQAPAKQETVNRAILLEHRGAAAARAASAEHRAQSKQERKRKGPEAVESGHEEQPRPPQKVQRQASLDCGVRRRLRLRLQLFFRRWSETRRETRTRREARETRTRPPCLRAEMRWPLQMHTRTVTVGSGFPVVCARLAAASDRAGLETMFFMFGHGDPAHVTHTSCSPTTTPRRSLARCRMQARWPWWTSRRSTRT